MPTGDSFVNLVLKRFLSQSRMNGNFLNYLQEMFYDGISRIFPNHGLFTYPSGLVNNGDGTFTVGTDPLLGTDGDGHVLKLTGTSRNTNIPFEDTVATNYWIGLHYIEVPSGVYVNPRTGQVEYDLIFEEIGELSTPTSVADGGGGTIVIVVDSIFENGVDYSGRLVKVWLTNPMSADDAVAFETDLVVSYNGGTGENSVTTVGLLGQSTLSVATADYQVAALGVSVKKSASNPWTAGSYCILGYVEGSSSNETLIDSNDLSGGGGHTLQKAYDGGGGAGDGRNVTVANEAIDLDQLNLTLAAQDVFHAPLRLTKDGDRSVITNPVPPFDVKDNEGGIDVLQRMLALYAYMCRVNLVDGSGSDYLRGSEAAEIVFDPQTITLTRVGADLTFTGNSSAITPDFDYVQIVSSSNGNDGIYRVIGYGPTSFGVENLDGTTASLTLETGTSMEVRFYRPIFNVNTFDYINSNDQVSLLVSNLDGFLVDYGGGGFHIPLKIIGAADSDAITPMFVIDNYLGASIFNVRYDGRIDARGLLDMNGNDIDTASGDITTGGGLIDSEGGVIQSGGGNILTEGGDFIAATPGNVTASGGTVTGSYVESLGDVTADSNANGTGDFKYGAAKQQWISVPIGDFRIAEQGHGTIIWNYSNTSDSWAHVGTDLDVLIAPVYLPDGATITATRAKVYGNVIGSIDAYLIRHFANWASASGSPTETNIATMSNLSTSTWEVVIDVGLSEVVDNVLYSYFIQVESNQNDDRIAGLQVQISLDTVTMF